MEIERLGENKIRCALSEEEIREMGYNIDEIIGNTEVTQEFMRAVVELVEERGQYQYAEYFTGSEGRTFAGSQHGDHVWRRFRDEF